MVEVAEIVAVADIIEIVEIDEVVEIDIFDIIKIVQILQIFGIGNGLFGSPRRGCAPKNSTLGRLLETIGRTGKISRQLEQ